MKAALVLAWHAVTYYREMRDRQLQSLELESLLRHAELQALRNQLNPHFLFNTLHSIAELVTENPTLAEQLILRLGQLFRRALHSSSAETVPLADEIDFVKCYLEIEQMRLGERLQVHWDIGSEVLNARVPNLLLQPLVENAIQHGIAPTGGPGNLTIRAERLDENLRLQVRDDGPGLPQASPLRVGTGLANTQSRLHRLYGVQHRFELISEKGLLVSVRLPFTAAIKQETHSS